MTIPRAVLVDMDGTLVDSESRWLVAESRMMAELGADWTPEDQLHCLGGPIERLVTYMHEKAKPNIPHDELSRRLLSYVEAAFQQEQLDWRLGIVNLLMQARQRDIPIGMVTASDRSLVDVVLEQLDGELGFGLFTTVVAHGDAARGKPHPDPYLLGAERLGVSPRDVLAFEDSPTGVASAVAAGCAVIAVPHLAPIEVPGSYSVFDLPAHDIAGLWSLASNHRSQD
jgi:tRNA (adenine57-N1/adenine58-N1)-methyltransferase